MEPKKYRKNYWSRMLILIVIIIGGISLYLYIKYDYSEKATIDSNNLITTAPCMITTNIAWHDSICKVVLDEIELVSVIDEEDYITKPFYENFIKLSDKGKHSKKCTFYTLRFGCSFAAVNTIKPQLL